MTLSIIIPAYNEEQYIKKTLESIFNNASEDLLEVIVVNNASTDKTAEVAKSFSQVRVVDQPQKGLTKARQKGLESAKGDLVAYLDADTLVSKKWFSVLHEEFEKNKDLVCLSGPYYYYDIPKWQRWGVGMYWQHLAQHTYEVTGYMAVGGNLVAKRQSLLDVGGFDLNIHFYGEDTDIARRLHNVGAVTFSQRFLVATSGRRFIAEGLLRTAFKYIVNYASVVIFKKPLTKKYNDVR